MTPRRWTCLHLFAGIGGCTLGFKRAGLRSLGSIDIDAKAIEQLRRMTGGSPAFVRDLATLQPGDLRALVPTSPDVVVMSPPCKSFSGCMPAARAAEDRYVDMSQLAVRGVFLALETWPEHPPGYILIENVPRIRTRGAPMLEQIVALLQRYGYATDQRVHDCGELGGLAQHRDRFLLMARNMERCPAFLRRPPPRRVRAVGEVLLPLPSPVADHGDPMHKLPLLSAMNWLRLAAIPAGKDWRALPEEIRLTWDREAHGGRPDSFGVMTPTAPSPTVRGRQEVQTSRASIADPRLAPRAGRFKGKLQVSPATAPSNTITGTSAQPSLGACAVLADPRLGCEPRNGAYGVQDAGEAAPAVLGHGSHDNSVGSLADPRLAHKPRRGSLGVMAEGAPAPTVRARHEARQAPAAVVDSRGWPIPTHEMVREADGALVLHGPPIDLEDKRPCLLVIRALDGTWHRPITRREAFTLQSGPLDFVIEGPRTSSKAQAGVQEWIGNMIPVDAAEAIGLELIEALASSTPATLLRGPDVWVERAEALEAGA